MAWNNLRDRGTSVVYYGQFSCGSFVYLLLFVDDMLITAKNMFEIKRLKSFFGWCEENPFVCEYFR